MKDVLVSLTEDHVLLSRLADRVRSTSERLFRDRLFDELAKALGGHFGAVEYVILPACSRSGSCSLRSGVLIAHMNLKRRLADLLAMERRNASFERELLRFCDEVEAQADIEQLELLPALRACLDDADRAFLATEAEAQMSAHLGSESPLDATDPSERRTAADVLQEAEVVASLAARRAALHARGRRDH
jgi:hypothetical protein